MKLWLASFPRSGNTYVRIVLDEIYNITSSEYPEPNKILNNKYHHYPVVKTHLLPIDIISIDPSIPAAYIVRDGRDALVSMAHHRKDIVDPKSNYYKNLKEAIISPGGSNFGGWSTNVEQWMKRTKVIIKFEDLIKDPIESVGILNSLIDMPTPQKNNLPSFEDLKNSKRKSLTNSISLANTKKLPDRRKKFFRRGIVGSWKDEMPNELHELFWEMHSEAMIKLGYTDGAPN